MTLTRELAEVKALASKLDQRVGECLDQLTRIQEARGPSAGPKAERKRQDQPQAGPAGSRNGAEPLIAFVHIPKTAGGTVTSMFAAAYSRRAVGTAGNYVRGPEKAERKITRRPGGWDDWLRRGGRLSVGHMPYGVFRKHLPADTRYMTFLREPIDRVLSHYYRHVHRPDQSRPREKNPRPGQGQKIKADSLEEALVELNLPQLNNLSTRFLCGHDSPMGDLPASAVADAKENLRHFAFLGIQERFEESLVLLQRMLGLSSVPYVDRHVAREGGRPAVDEIPDQQRALIADRNSLDAELYVFGLELFEETVAAAGETLAAEAEALRAADQAAREEAWRTAVPPPQRRVADPAAP